MKTDHQIATEASVKIGELVHPAACLDGFKQIVYQALLESAEAARSTRAPRPGNFNYVISYGGGIGPDVWDKEMEISAVDINDAIAQACGYVEDSGGWVFMVSQEDYPQSTRDQLEEKLHELRMRVAELEQQIESNPRALFVPTERAKQMWPSEMPSCQIVDGGINVNAKTVAFAAQEMMHRAYDKAKILRMALEAITRNQSEKDGEDGICPFGCDAPWVAMSALGTWKQDGIAPWSPK